MSGDDGSANDIGDCIGDGRGDDNSQGSSGDLIDDDGYFGGHKGGEGI